MNPLTGGQKELMVILCRSNNRVKKFINYKGSKLTVIIADTIAGKGLRSIEGLVEAHGKPIFKSDIGKVN